MADDRPISRVLRVAAMGLLAAASVGGQEARLPAHYVLPLALHPLERQRVPIENARIILPEGRDGSPQTVAVAFRRTDYMCTLLDVTENRLGELRTRLTCYELDAEGTYTWSMWIGRHMANVRLFANGPGDNYLAWVDLSLVVVADVSKPQDRCLSLAQYSPGEEYSSLMTVQVAPLVPESRLWGVDDSYQDIRVQSFAKKPDGTFELRISNPEGTKFYTIIGQGHEWRLAEPEPNPTPRTGNPETGTAPKPAQPPAPAE